MQNLTNLYFYMLVLDLCAISRTKYRRADHQGKKRCSIVIKATFCYIKT